MNKKDQVLEIFTKHETTLYSIVEILDKLKIEEIPVNYKNIESIIRKLRMKEVVYRHKERDSNGDLQYAFKIKTSDIEPWVLNTKMSNCVKGSKGSKVSKKTSKNKLLSRKEIQSMFAAQYNTLARLEDEVIKIINEFELTEKEMSKIRNFIGK